MSQGIFRLSDGGPYKTAGGKEIPADVYARVDYTDDYLKRCFADWGILDSNWETLSRIIGEFLEKIQGASMVSVESAREQTGGPIDPNDSCYGYLSCEYHTTLSPERLVEVIRDEFAGILLKIAAFSQNPNIAQKYEGLSRFHSNVPSSMRHLPSLRFSAGKNNKFEGIDFLTPESETLLQILDVSEGIIESVQQALRGFADITFVRAKLSRPSTLLNLAHPPAFSSPGKTPGRKNEKPIRPSIMYSTLHPYDYIRMVREQLSPFLHYVAFAIYKEQETVKAA